MAKDRTRAKHNALKGAAKEDALRRIARKYADPR